MHFSTNDNDNDQKPTGKCAQDFKGAWWYNLCLQSNLNGLYLKGEHSSHADGVNWKKFPGLKYSLKRTEIKIKPKS